MMIAMLQAVALEFMVWRTPSESEARAHDLVNIKASLLTTGRWGG